MLTDLIVKTSALGWATHPAVAGEESTAAAEREAVGGVVAEELGGAGGDQGHQALLPPGLVVVGAGHLPQVGHGGGGERPLEGAVTQQGVAGQEEHRANTFANIQYQHRIHNQGGGNKETLFVLTFKKKIIRLLSI